jgi:hypothetical protein
VNQAPNLEAALPHVPCWRAVFGVLLAAMPCGCTYSDKPLLPESEALDNNAFAGRFAVSKDGKLEYWNVVRQGHGYLVTKKDDDKKSYRATLHQFDNQFSLVQGIQTSGGDGEPNYNYMLVYIGPNYLLVEWINCNADIAREVKLDVERANDYSCKLRSENQLMILARQTAAKFYDPKNMSVALRANEDGSDSDQ